MATPTLTSHSIPGALGEIFVDLRCGDRILPRPAVLLAHGFKGSKDVSFLPRVADRLATAGFAVVSFTTSGAGVDGTGAFTRIDQFRRNSISADLEDFGHVLTALESGGLGTPPPSSVGLLGFSRGGGVAVLFAARTPRVRALVTWAALARLRRWSDAEATEWRNRGEVEVTSSLTGQRLPLGTELLDDVEANAMGLDIPGAAAALEVPWLIVHGTADRTVPVEEGRELSRAASGAVSTLWIDGADHHFGAAVPFAGVTPALSRALDATVSHFARYLR